MKTIIELEADDALAEYDRSVRIANRVIVETGTTSRRILEETHAKGQKAFTLAMQAAYHDDASEESILYYKAQANSIALLESEPREKFKWEPN